MVRCKTYNLQEALLLPTNLTWRALGGSIDLYFFDGPTQDQAIQQYQAGAIGLPVMQQYWTFGLYPYSIQVAMGC
jgi:alpha-glucosidase